MIILGRYKTLYNAHSGWKIKLIKQMWLTCKCQHIFNWVWAFTNLGSPTVLGHLKIKNASSFLLCWHMCLAQVLSDSSSQNQFESFCLNKLSVSFFLFSTKKRLYYWKCCYTRLSPFPTFSLAHLCPKIDSKQQPEKVPKLSVFWANPAFLKSKKFICYCNFAWPYHN